MKLDKLVEKKIKLTVERAAFDRLKEDLFLFDIPNMSRLIECVVLAYCNESVQLRTIESAMSSELAIRMLLSEKAILFKKTLLGLLVGGDKNLRRSIKEESACYNWTITKSAYHALRSDERTHDEPYAFIGKLLEEFASFTIAQKESVIRAKAVEEINEAINKGFPFEYVSKSGIVYVMHPDRIVVDSFLNYTYVIGNSVALEDYDPSTFEPSEENIKNIRFINLRYNKQCGCWLKLRYGEKIRTCPKEIDQRLKEVSPAFVGEYVYDVKVLLNEWGERTYKSIIVNRPKCISKADTYIDGFKEYMFRCTLFQAVIYFMNFEDSAKIISPPEAVERIKTRIDALNRIYQ